MGVDAKHAFQARLLVFQGYMTKDVRLLSVVRTLNWLNAAFLVAR